MFGCEVCLDVAPAHRGLLQDVQHELIRSLLGLHRRSILAVSFSETGGVPLRHRRVSLAVGYLGYLMSLRPTHLADVAFWDSLALELARNGHPG
jgi:hypothetical protein